MFSKPFGQIDGTDLRDLCARRAPADLHLEFKEALRNAEPLKLER
jgi:hypothetical protein